MATGKRSRSKNGGSRLPPSAKDSLATSPRPDYPEPVDRDEFEWTVRTVVAGGDSERFGPGRGDWIECRLDEPGVGTGSGRSRTEDLPKDRVTSARTALPPAGQWSPWPSLPEDEVDAIDLSPEPAVPERIPR